MAERSNNHESNDPNRALAEAISQILANANPGVNISGENTGDIMIGGHNGVTRVGNSANASRGGMSIVGDTDSELTIEFLRIQEERRRAQEAAEKEARERAAEANNDQPEPVEESGSVDVIPPGSFMGDENVQYVDGLDSITPSVQVDSVQTTIDDLLQSQTFGDGAPQESQATVDTIAVDHDTTKTIEDTALKPADPVEDVSSDPNESVESEIEHAPDDLDEDEAPDESESPRSEVVEMDWEASEQDGTGEQYQTGDWLTELESDGFDIVEDNNDPTRENATTKTPEEDLSPIPEFDGSSELEWQSDIDGGLEDDDVNYPDAMGDFDAMQQVFTDAHERDAFLEDFIEDVSLANPVEALEELYEFLSFMNDGLPEVEVLGGTRHESMDLVRHLPISQYPSENVLMNALSLNILVEMIDGDMLDGKTNLYIHQHASEVLKQDLIRIIDADLEPEAPQPAEIASSESASGRDWTDHFEDDEAAAEYFADREAAFDSDPLASDQEDSLEENPALTTTTSTPPSTPALANLQRFVDMPELAGLSNLTGEGGSEVVEPVVSDESDWRNHPDYPDEEVAEAYFATTDREPLDHQLTEIEAELRAARTTPEETAIPAETFVTSPAEALSETVENLSKPYPVFVHQWLENGAGWQYSEGGRDQLMAILKLLDYKNPLAKPDEGQVVQHYQLSEDGETVFVGVSQLDTECPDEKARDRRPFILRATAIPKADFGTFNVDAIYHALSQIPRPTTYETKPDQVQVNLDFKTQEAEVSGPVGEILGEGVESMTSYEKIKIPGLEVVVGSNMGLGDKEVNEDRALVLENGTLLVADGMGFHGEGNFAAQTLAESVQAQNGDISTLDLEFERRFGSSRSGTCFALFKPGTEPELLQAGDVRTMIYREDPLTPFRFQSKDESMAQFREDSGEITMTRDGEIIQGEEVYYSQRNIVTSSIGWVEGRLILPNQSMGKDLGSMGKNIKEGDIIIMCSDGVSGLLTDSDIARFIKSADGSIEDAYIAITEVIQDIMQQYVKQKAAAKEQLEDDYDSRAFHKEFYKQMKELYPWLKREPKADNMTLLMARSTEPVVRFHTDAIQLLTSRFRSTTQLGMMAGPWFRDKDNVGLLAFSIAEKINDIDLTNIAPSHLEILKAAYNLVFKHKAFGFEVEEQAKTQIKQAAEKALEGDGNRYLEVNTLGSDAESVLQSFVGLFGQPDSDPDILRDNRAQGSFETSLQVLLAKEYDR